MLRRAPFLALVLVASLARAQDAGVDGGDAAPDPAAEALRHAIDSDPWTGTGSPESTDPLAGADTAALAEVVDDPTIEQVEAPIPIQHGEILEAISGVRESSHEIAATLEGGLAVVTETIVLGSTARHRAEARVRLGVPVGAALVSLHVENAVGAREGVADPEAGMQGAYDDALLARSTTPSALPIAHARVTSDERGSAIVLRAAPVGTGNGSDDDGTLTLRVTWVAATPMHGGVARLAIPARGADDRAVRPEVTLTAVDVVEPRVGEASYERGAVAARNDAPIVVSALAPLSRGPRVDAAIVPCGGERCAILRATGGRARPSSAPITLAIDASPSTSAGARGRIADAVRVITGLLPSGTPVRWIAFAARAQDLGHGGPSDLDAEAVRAAVDAPLGSATRFSALWGAIEASARAGDRVVVIGDGGLTVGAGETAALDAARARGIVLSAIDVADRSPTEALAAAVASTGGVIVEAAQAAEAAAAGHGDTRLGELVSGALGEALPALSVRVDGRARPVGALRPGESLLLVGPATRADIALGDQHVSARAPDAAHATILSALAAHTARLVAVDAGDLGGASICTSDGTMHRRARASAISGQGLRVAPAERRACTPTLVTTATVDGGSSLPRAALRYQLRRRVIPPARACFRDDRAGRASVHREVTFSLLLADREIVAVDVEGELSESLRTCLLGAFDGMEVPSFDGTLAVRWPVHTEAIAPPPVIELAPDVAREVHAIAGDEPIPTAP